VSWVILYDEDNAGYAAAFSQLHRKHHIASEDIERQGNRIELLDAIAERNGAAIALIDLESNEVTDQQYSGHRIIETISRHPDLRLRCRPIAFTQHARPDVIDLARRHGAAALISKLTLDGLDNREPLAAFLERHRAAHEAGQTAEFELYPQTAIDDQRARAYVEKDQAAMDRVFREPPKLFAHPYFWDVISLLAEGLDLQSVSAYVAVDHNANASTVKIYIEKMAGSMKPRYRIRKTHWQDFARQLLRDLPHRRAAPSDERLVRALHRLHALEGLVDDGMLIEKSYLDPDALSALKRVWNPYADAPRVDKGLGNVADTAYRERLDARLKALAVDEQDRLALQSAFVRAVYNLYDTYLAAELLRDEEL
jgi:hypothetical protein